MIILTTSHHIIGFIDKWISEPLRAIIISSKLFSVNKKKNLFLPPRMQQILVVLCAKFQVEEITLYAKTTFEALNTLIYLFCCKFVLVSMCTCMLIFLHTLVTESYWYSIVLCIHYLPYILMSLLFLSFLSFMSHASFHTVACFALYFV
jgi:PRMT5 TIM barrel domain